MVVCLLSLGVWCWTTGHAADSATGEPNVVYMMADALRWSDLSIHPGGITRTPNIDLLFKQGIKLDNFMG